MKYGIVDFMDDVQKEIIKAMLNDRADAVIYFYGPDSTTWFTDGRHAEAVYNSLLLIDPASITAKRFDHRLRTVATPAFMTDERNPLTDTKESVRKNTSTGEHVYRILKNSAGDRVYIDEKYLKRYKKLDIGFSGNGPREPVFVESAGQTAGLIMPAVV